MHVPRYRRRGLAAQHVLPVPAWLTELVTLPVERVVCVGAGRVALELRAERRQLVLELHRLRPDTAVPMGVPCASADAFVTYGSSTTLPAERALSLARVVGARLLASSRLTGWLDEVERVRRFLDGDGSVPPMSALQRLWQGLHEPATLRRPERGSSFELACSLHVAIADDRVADALEWSGQLTPSSVLGMHASLCIDALLGQRERAEARLRELAREGSVPNSEGADWVEQAVTSAATLLRSAAPLAVLPPPPSTRAQLRRLRVRAELDDAPVVVSELRRLDEELRGEQVLEAARLFEGLGAFDAAHELYGRAARDSSAEADVALARLELWADRPERAALSDDPLLRGVAAARRGQWGRAREDLELAVREREREPEPLLWLARAELAAGRARSARRYALDALLCGNTFPGRVLRALIACHDPQPLTALQLRRPAQFDGLFADELPHIRDRLRSNWRRYDIGWARARLFDELEQLGGNLGRPLTRKSEGTRLGIEAWEPPPTPRAASVGVLQRLRSGVPAVTLLEELESLGRRYPHSPQPLTYRGELLLWLGRYEEARRVFWQALMRSDARWAWVGASAAETLLGRPRRAKLISRLGGLRHSFLATATTPVYEGEALRNEGKPDQAIEQLEAALEAKSTRVASWMNLALAYGAVGRDADRARVLTRLERQAAPWIWLATNGRRARFDARADATLRRILELMQGNRSSTLHTFVDPASGELRLLPPSVDWVRHVRELLPQLRELVRRRILDDLTG